MLRVFIGSSTEAKKFVEDTTAYILDNFGGQIEPVPWTSDWKSGSYPLESLDDFVRTTDGSILFWTADDATVHRGKKRFEPRDNLHFEAGLFFGCHGRERTQLFVPTYKTKQVAIPSDLAGLTLKKFTWHEDRGVSSTGLPRACRSACERLLELGPRGHARASRLTALTDHRKIELVSSYVGSFHQMLPNGIARVADAKTCDQVDIVVAYELRGFLSQVDSFLTEFKSRRGRGRRLRVVFADMSDDTLMKAYQRKYFDVQASEIRTTLANSIRDLLGGLDVCNVRCTRGGVTIAPKQASRWPTINCQIALTSQRITYSYYRLQDVAFVIPLDMKRKRDPAPLAWSCEEQLDPSTFLHYQNEFNQVFREAKKIFPF